MSLRELKPHLFREDGTRRAAGRKNVEDLLASVHPREDAAAGFLKALTDAELERYAVVISEPRPEIDLALPPDITGTAPASTGDWLHALWKIVECDFDDEECPTLPFRDWVIDAAADPFYRHHLHARFHLEVTEPQFELFQAPEGPSQ